MCDCYSIINPSSTVRVSITDPGMTLKYSLSQLSNRTKLGKYFLLLFLNFQKIRISQYADQLYILLLLQFLPSISLPSFLLSLFTTKRTKCKERTDQQTSQTYPLIDVQISFNSFFSFQKETTYVGNNNLKPNRSCLFFRS